VTPVSILTDALRRIPAGLRLGLLVLFAIAVVATQILEAFSVDLHDGIYRTLVIVGGYLGVQSAVNVSSGDRDPDGHDPDEVSL